MNGESDDPLHYAFEAEVIYWRGPAPFFYAPMPPEDAARLAPIAKSVTYGWGVIPVMATVGGVTFKTSLFPKDGTFLVPLKVAVRRKTEITAGDKVHVDMTITPKNRLTGGL